MHKDLYLYACDWQNDQDFLGTKQTVKRINASAIFLTIHTLPFKSLETT